VSTTTPARRYAPLAQAAKYVGCDQRTIRRYIATGQLRGYRLGERLIRVDLNELDALLRPIPTAGERLIRADQTVVNDLIKPRPTDFASAGDPDAA